MTTMSAPAQLDGYRRPLGAAGLISQDEARLTRLLDTFGALIANTDRHLGNLSLFADNVAHSLAPAYDMLPMAYRPTDQGEVRAVEFRPPTPTGHQCRGVAAGIADGAGLLGRNGLAVTAEISEGLRQIAAQNAALLVKLQRLGAPVTG
jgi:hypothetical protein